MLNWTPPWGRHAASLNLGWRPQFFQGDLRSSRELEARCRAEGRMRVRQTGNVGLDGLDHRNAVGHGHCHLAGGLCRALNSALHPVGHAAVEPSTRREGRSQAFKLHARFESVAARKGLAADRNGAERGADLARSLANRGANPGRSRLEQKVAALGRAVCAAGRSFEEGRAHERQRADHRQSESEPQQGAHTVPSLAWQMRPKRPSKNGAGFPEKTELVVELVGNRVAYLGGDDGRSHNHSDKAKSNQQVMHVGFSWCESAATVHIWIISFPERN